MSKQRRFTDNERTKRLQGFLADGFHDYIAARVLLRTRLPKQGAILSSTAIEKCFKAILAFGGNESPGHLKTAHWNAVENFDPELFGELDLEFLKLNQKAYGLRYTDSVPVDFNLIIASREFLAELDTTLCAIFRRFQVEQNGKRQQMPFEAALAARDERLVRENHALSGQDKNAFMEEKTQTIYEVRNDPKLGLIEVIYDTTPESEFKRAGFLREALIPT